MKVSKLMKMLPVMLVACMLLSSVSAFAAVEKPDNISDVTQKVTVVVSNMAENEEVAIMVYDKAKRAENGTPADVAAADILYIDQAAAKIKIADGNYGVTFEFYLKDGAEATTKEVAIGSATASAVTYETFDINAAPAYKVGDVNGDGIADTLDAVLIMKYSVGGYDVGVFNAAAANVNGDDSIDTIDAILIMKHSVGGYGEDVDKYFK